MRLADKSDILDILYIKVINLNLECCVSLVDRSSYTDWVGPSTSEGGVLDTVSFKVVINIPEPFNYITS